RPVHVEIARQLAADLKQDLMAMYDDTGAIGKLYRRQDEIGTPFCLTVDVESLDDHAVTVRDRDTMEQDRVALDKVVDFVRERLATGSPAPVAR
ncbi:glycine--tRNA ligase, partial [Candidatus Poribacteria bacterium]|nr:glycine--tRNA ligase [Candidatus Poribacteria bacterium]